MLYNMFALGMASYLRRNREEAKRKASVIYTKTETRKPVKQQLRLANYLEA